MSCDIPPIKLGSLLLTLLEPKAGYEKQFHRWYERDHFYAGCMIGENFFSGRRWVATRTLKELRFPPETPIVDDVSKGSFLASYWILDQRDDEAVQWSIAQVHQLHSQQRMAPPRDNISSGFYRYEFGAFRDRDGVPAELALEHPYKGLGITFIDFHERYTNDDIASGVAGRLASALETSLTDSCCGMSLCFAPQPLPDEVPAYVPRVAKNRLERRRLLLHFLEADPTQCWPSFMASLSALLETYGVADITYAAPFIPTIPGTDTYLDQLS